MIRNIITDSVRHAAALLLVIVAGYMLLEPTIGYSANTTQFTISQTVTSEVSFTTPATNVVLGPSLGGITGGTATGGTQVIVATNDHLGYTMTLTASSSVGMLGNSNPANSIPAYIPGTVNVPDYSFNAPANRARFGYTVAGSTTADVAPAFLNNGSNTCNSGATGNTTGGTNHCWLNASTTAFTIVNRSSSTPGSGATTTLIFQVTISANPAPTIPDDTYVATTTLTATAN